MGRGRGNSKHRGRGGSRGRGGKRGHYESDSLSRKDVAHIRQFGEKHPSQELGRDFGPAASEAKRGKFDRGRGRGRRGSFAARGRNDKSQASHSSAMSSESDSEEEEETTPYNELLSVFSGRKNDAVQVVSDDDEDDDDDDDTDDSDVQNDDDGIEQKDVSGESDSEVSNKDLFDSDGQDDNDIDGHDSHSDNLNENSDSDAEENLVEKVKRSKQKVKSGETEEPETEEPEDTVIEEAELDPELNEDENITGLHGVDPFVQHYEREMPEQLQNELKKDQPNFQTHNIDWPVIERFTYRGLKKFPKDEDDAINCPQKTIHLSDVDKLPEVTIPDPPLTPVKNPNLTSLKIKSQLHATIPIANQANIDKKGCKQPLTSLQTELIDLASRYHDMYLPIRDMENAEEIRLAYCLHVANHVLKTRTRILHHNAKMANKTDVPEAYRDQGFVRPKVLILAPFKDSALRIVKILISLILKEEKGNVANRKRFEDEYGGETLFMPKTNPKPEDYMMTFHGNVEDNFKIGMAVTKKSIKLYTGFYSSDIIVASPLGLRMIIGAEGEKDRDYDFLSSIEVLILDQADVFLMQNWDHVLHIMRHLHLQPITTHGTDFARIRPWALDGLSKYYCQTLIFSSISCPEHSSLMSKYSKNYAGQTRVVPTNLKGSICHVTVQLPQVFQHFDVGSINDVDDKRFEYFTKHVVPNFKEKLMSHTLIFVSSYFDFVRIRNYFKREEVSFVQICEYTKDKKIARSRDLFFHGTNHFLLYTERSHFFRRFRLKGIGHIIFYQLPQNPHFYPELCNFVQENFQNRRVRQRKNSSVNVIYCKYDAPRLAAIVGTERAGHMLTSQKKIHAFVSGEL